MSRGALGAFGSICFFLVTISHFWTTTSADRVRTKSHASSVSLDNTASSWNTHSRGESPGGPITISADDVVEASPHPNPGMRQRWWKRILPEKKPKSTESEEYDESKLMRLPTFMRSDKTFREKLIRLFDKIYQRFRRKQVMRDLYRRHAEDERVYGGNDDDDM